MRVVGWSKKMCSLQPDDDWAPAALSKTALTGNSDCVKCKAILATIILRDASYCDSCFKVVFSHRVRMAAGKAFKTFQAQDTSLGASKNQKIRILLALDASLNAAVLLHAILEPYLSAPNRPCPFEFVAVYIDNPFSNQKIEQEAFLSICKERYNIAAHCVPLSSIFHEGSPERDHEVFEKLYTTLPSQTLKNSALKILVTDLLMQLAVQYSCSTVFMATGCQDNAVSLISQVAQGRGYTLPIESAPFYSKNILFSDVRHIIHVVKPLRDITSEEISKYTLVHQVDRFAAAETTLKVSSSIQEITKSFLFNLQEGFPSTVSTVTRTGSKIATEVVSPDDTTVTMECLLCGMSVQRDSHAWKNRITISSLPSSNTPTEDGTLTATLCYGCEYFRPFIQLFPVIKF